jgi:hypothetical protein
LPLEEADRQEFIEASNHAFAIVLERIEPQNVEVTKALWEAGDYVDHHLLTPNMLPIDRDYALSLIDAFLLHYVIGLAVDADELEDGLISRH